MSRQQLDVLVPMLYGLAIVVASLLTDAVVAVAVIGAILVGIYYGVVRRSLTPAEGGRDRQRNRRR